MIPNQGTETVVPAAGLEPALPLGKQILSLLRLPIPPSGRPFLPQSYRGRSRRGDNGVRPGILQTHLPLAGSPSPFFPPSVQLP